MYRGGSKLSYLHRLKSAGYSGTSVPGKWTLIPLPYRGTGNFGPRTMPPRAKPGLADTETRAEVQPGIDHEGEHESSSESEDGDALD